MQIVTMKSFYESLGLRPENRIEVRALAKRLKVKVKELDLYQQNHILPFEHHMAVIKGTLGISALQLKIRMGIFDSEVYEALLRNEELLVTSVTSSDKEEPRGVHSPEYQTKYGTLYQGDCMEFMRQTESNKYDMIFADPPFNLDKFYLSDYDDNVSHHSYLRWCFSWLDECVRLLKPGGSLFVWNIPKWNTYLANHLNQKLLFRHWISVDIKFSLPINSRLYPSHYSLLYYSKGKPKIFKPDRLPMEVCKRCLSDLKDYGGYKNKMNPLGVNLTDVWYDIPPVRHNKYKRRKEANELTIKLLDRIIEMSTEEGDLVFDPFGGSGTTYVAAEIKSRRWEGIELGPLDDVIKRFQNIKEDERILRKYRSNYNNLFPPKIKAKRMQLRLWTDESFDRQSNTTPNAI